MLHYQQQQTVSHPYYLPLKYIQEKEQQLIQKHASQNNINLNTQGGGASKIGEQNQKAILQMLPAALTGPDSYQLES